MIHLQGFWYEIWYLIHRVFGISIFHLSFEGFWCHPGCQVKQSWVQVKHLVAVLTSVCGHRCSPCWGIKTVLDQSYNNAKVWILLELMERENLSTASWWGGKCDLGLLLKQNVGCIISVLPRGWGLWDSDEDDVVEYWSYKGTVCGSLNSSSAVISSGKSGGGLLPLDNMSWLLISGPNMHITMVLSPNAQMQKGKKDPAYYLCW